MQSRRVFLVVMAIVSLMLSPMHWHAKTQTHVCDMCLAAHMAAVPAVSGITFAPPLSFCRHYFPEESRREAAALIADTPNRAPPVPFVR